MFAVAIPATVPSLCALSRSRRLSFPCALCGLAWVSGQVRAERVLAGANTIDSRKEWICEFCAETNVWTRWRCRLCGNNIPAGLQGKHKQATYAKNKERYSGSSSSSGGEEWRLQGQHEEIKKLRAQVELFSKQQGAGTSPEEPSEPARARGADDNGHPAVERAT